MKRLFLALTLVALALPQAGQAGWWRTFGDSGFDEGRCVQVASDGNYAIAGHTDGMLWLFKTDTSGTVLFSQTYEGGATWCEETFDSGFIISGTPDLMKTDSLGDSLWAWDYGVNSLCVQETRDGGYIVLGDEGGLYTDYFLLIKTDSQGNTSWQQNYAKPGNNWNKGYFLQVTDDGGYIVTGLTGYIDYESWNVWSTSWLVKADSEGNMEWNKIYGEEELWNVPMRGNCVRQTEDGGYVITGLTVGGLWLIRTNDSGDSLWAKVFGISSQGTGYGVQQTDDGGYIIVGTTESIAAALSPAVRDLWLIKTDGQGDTVWTRKYPGGGNEAIGYCVQQIDDQGYIVVGELNSDLYLLRTDSLGLLGVEEQPHLDRVVNWQVVSQIGMRTVVEYTDLPGGFHADVFDVSGRHVDRIRNPNPSGTITWGQGYPAGVYFIQALDNRGELKEVKVEIIR